MGEEIQLTYTAVGRGLVASPIVNFPAELKIPVQESRAQDIHFSPVFSPIFQPESPILNPVINVTVEPTPYQITVPKMDIEVLAPEQVITLTSKIQVPWLGLGAILFANSAFIVILLFALNYYFYEFEWLSSPTISN